MLPSLRGLILRNLRGHAGACSQVPDAELLQRFVLGRDEAAFELLLWRHGSLVLHTCTSLLGDVHAAEDVFQATFLTLACKASAIRQSEALASWLHQVACRIALRLRRQTARRHDRERADSLIVGSAQSRPGADLDLRDCRPILHEELQRLPARYRQPIILCYFQGLTHEEAAAQLGWPRGTVAGRLARAKKLLHRRLTRRGVVLGVAGVLGLHTMDLAAAAVPVALVQRTVRTAALAVAGQMAAIATPILVLSKGVLRTMFWEKAKTLAAMIVILTMAAGGAGWLVTARSGDDLELAQPRNDQDKAAAPREQDKPSAKPDEALAGHLRTQHNLKQIGVAMHNHEAAYKVFPGPAIFSENGKPLLSWRVALLPFLRQHDLYKQFRVGEPWDSDHNKKLLEKMPDVYRSPGAKDPTATHYQVFVGPRTIFEGPRGIGFAQIPDGTSYTLMVVEAAAAVPWTKPEDLAYAATGKIPDLGGVHPGVFYALFADGSVHALKQRFEPQDLRIAITRDEGLVTPRKKLIDPAPGLDDPVKLKAELDKKMRTLRKAQDDIQHLRGTLLDLQRAAAREHGTGAVDQLKGEYEAIVDEVERAAAEREQLQSRIDELRKKRP
jgi:RNA polymerase sigma factor (sigma-70 family)